MKNLFHTYSHKITGLLLLILCVLAIDIQQVKAQGKEPIIQFSGIIIGGDNSEPVAGAHIYVPKAGRGTSTNPYGFFSMPVMVATALLSVQ
jgi:hypothetical protein